MVTITREERANRRPHDPGEPDDMVVVPRKIQNNHCYHDDEDCQYLPPVEDCRSVTRSNAQGMDRTPCKSCVLDDADRELPPDEERCIYTEDGERCKKYRWLGKMCHAHRVSDFGGGD